MKESLVMTVIGQDRPGLVDAISQAIASQGANWLESRMAHLGGQFAGILRVEVNAATREPLVAALSGLTTSGLRVIIEAAETVDQPEGLVRKLELLGQDRPGIVREISGVLAKHGVNVEELETETTSAPMTGETLFKATAMLRLPNKEVEEVVKKQLEAIGSDMMVDIQLD